ncbi:MAG: hypothetical protein CL674_16740 [Bdellovibrionaceae bacterium]|nr:hypothetical protein [Pseudobdellovibrionaceae bacterium]
MFLNQAKVKCFSELQVIGLLVVKILLCVFLLKRFSWMVFGWAFSFMAGIKLKALGLSVTGWFLFLGLKGAFLALFLYMM